MQPNKLLCSGKRQSGLTAPRVVSSAKSGVGISFRHLLLSTVSWAMVNVLGIFLVIVRSLVPESLGLFQNETNTFLMTPLGPELLLI